MRRPSTNAKVALYLAPVIFVALVGAAGWQVGRPSLSATPAPTPGKLIAVPIDPQLCADGHLIAAGIQLLERFDVIDPNGNKDYVDQMVAFEARFWDAKTLVPLPSLPLRSTPGEMAQSPDGSLLAINESEHGFRVVDLAARQTLWSTSDEASVRVQSTTPGMILSLPPHGLSHAVFSPDGRTLALWDVFLDADRGTYQCTGYLFDARNGLKRASWKNAPGSRLDDPTLAFSPQGDLLASNEQQPLIYQPGAPSQRPQRRSTSEGTLLRTLPWNHARIVAFGSRNRLLLLINSSQYGTDAMEVDATTGKRVWSHTGTVEDTGPEGALSTIDTAFYSNDKRWIALGFRGSKSVEILDAGTGKLPEN